MSEQDWPVVNFWTDDPSVGCGYRRFIVISVGPKWATLFYAPTLTTIKVDRAEFDRHAKAAMDAIPTRVARIIQRNVKSAKRMKHQYSSESVTKALEALRAN